MSEKYSFFPDIEYSTFDWANYFSSFIGNGVFPNPSTNLQVIANNDMTVTLKVGKAFIDGYFYENETELILPIENADGVLKRKDNVVIRLDNPSNKITAKVIKGTFASKPIAPQVLRTVDFYDLKVAEIFIDAGAISIKQANITDTRLNSKVCGIVTQTVNTVDTTTLYNQVQADLKGFKNDEESSFNNWSTNQKTEHESWSTEQRSQFEQWFYSLKDILDDNTATNLYNLIISHTTNQTSHVTQAEKNSIPKTLTHSKTGTVHKLIGLNGATGKISRIASITAPYVAGDSITIDGVPYTIVTSNGEPLEDNAFIAGVDIPIIVDTENKKVNFKNGGGGGFPKSWKDERTAEFGEFIEKENPILMQRYANIEQGMSSLPLFDVLPAARMTCCTFNPQGTIFMTGCSAGTDAKSLQAYKIVGDDFQALSTISSKKYKLNHVAFNDSGTMFAYAWGYSTSRSYKYISVYSVQGETFSYVSEINVDTYGVIKDFKFINEEDIVVTISRASSQTGPTSYKFCSFKRNGDTYEKVNTFTAYGNIAYNKNKQIVVCGDSDEVQIFSVNSSAHMVRIKTDETARGRPVINSFTNDIYLLGYKQIQLIPYNNETSEYGDHIVAYSDLPLAWATCGAIDINNNYLFIGCGYDGVVILKINGQTDFTKMPDITPIPNRISSLAIDRGMNFMAIDTYDATNVRVYKTQAKDVIHKLTEWGNTEYWLKNGLLGMALETKSKGQKGKVNTFPPINNL